MKFSLGFLDTSKDTPSAYFVRLEHFVIDLKAGQLPCEMLNMPKNQLACQLAQRIEKIVDYLSPLCDDNWVRNYSGYMRALNESTKPADGSECPSLEIENHPGGKIIIIEQLRNSYVIVFSYGYP